MPISAADARRFLPVLLTEGTEAIKAADAHDNGNLTRAEARSLPADMRDTYDLYKEPGRTVRTDAFLTFFETHAKVSVRSGQLSGDLVDNFQAWRTRSTSDLTDQQRTDAMWDVMSTSGPIEAGPRLVATTALPASVKDWIDDARAASIAADPRTEDIVEMYEVPVSERDARVAGYVLLGWGEISGGTGYESMHMYSPDGRLLDREGEEVSF